MFDCQALHRQLNTLNIPINNLWIAFSGGVDSHVLLHSLTKLRGEFPEILLHAVHIHHGLHPDADAWSVHCQQVCEDLQTKCIVKKVDIQAHLQGRSVEEVARELRYLALSEILPEGGCLLTAHSQDDQAETLLQQLFRGAGVKGLAAMPDGKPFGKGQLLRPLLQVSRQSILDYARAEGLRWIEDSSNQNARFDRNYIRHQILPLLESRWEGVKPVLTRVAAHCAETNGLLEEMASADWQLAKGNMPNTLSVVALKKLSPARQRNLLRFWLRQLGLQVPSAVKLEQLRQDFLYSRSDATPFMRWEETQISRYRDDLFAFAPLASFDNKMIIPWDIQSPLALPANLGTLIPEEVFIDRAKLPEDAQITVRFRQGGERFHPRGRQGSHPLKKLFQEWGVPSWLRDRVPLIFNREELIVVVGLEQLLKSY